MTRYQWLLSTLLRVAFISLFAGLLALGCRPVVKTSKLSYIIGTNDVAYHHDAESEQDVAFDLGQLRSSSVLLIINIEGKFKTCTGSVINGPQGKKFVVANAHCYYQDSESLFPLTQAQVRDLCAQLQVLIFTSGNDWENLHYVQASCLEDSLHLSAEFDLSVFTPILPTGVSEIGLGIGSDKLEGSAIISHFPNFEGGEQFATRILGQELNLPRQAFTFKNCRNLGLFDENLVNQDHMLGYSIGHTCDLESGSSGSALVSYSGDIIGINWGGVELKKGDATELRNGAVRASVVESFIANSFPESYDGSLLLADKPKLMAKKTPENTAMKEKKLSGFRGGGCGVIGKNKAKSQ